MDEYGIFLEWYQTNEKRFKCKDLDLDLEEIVFIAWMTGRKFERQQIFIVYETSATNKYMVYSSSGIAEDFNA